MCFFVKCVCCEISVFFVKYVCIFVKYVCIFVKYVCCEISDHPVRDIFGLTADTYPYIITFVDILWNISERSHIK